MRDPLYKFRPVPVNPFKQTMKIGETEVPVFTYDIPYIKQVYIFVEDVLRYAALIKKNQVPKPQ